MIDWTLWRRTIVIWLCALAPVGLPMPSLAAISEEAATRVGGDLVEVGKRLDVLEDSVAKVYAALPTVPDDLVHAVQEIIDDETPEVFRRNLESGALVLALDLDGGAQE